MMQTLFLLTICAYSLGALGAILGGRGQLGRSLVGALAAIGATAGLLLGLTVIFTGQSFTAFVPALLPVGGGLALRLDPLGAFFLSVIGVVAIPASLYGIAYNEIYESERGSLRLLGAMFNLFLLAMSLVTLADNVFTFLLMWEGMSLTSYFLVITESDEAETIRAGNWYIAVTHVGVAFLVAAFLMLTGNASGAFSDLRVHASNLSPLARDLVFLLTLLGFGSKAGIIPLHVWLPRAHPAAPSYVSALMSGVMIKLGIYGLLRVALDFLGGGPAWWGVLVLVVGSVSAVLGVLYALMEHDLKRLLAYHSVENIGIILMGIGAGLLFHSYGSMSLAVLGLVGGLYHTLNHASFKGLLFLGAGSVLHATGTRNMEEMGGLMKRMPWTALFFLIGAAAISALPPLNGFVSEWLVFQALLKGLNIPGIEAAIAMPLAVGMLALTSGLAAACFVKAFGITFLAMPRSHEAESARESPLLMRIGMGMLAAICVVLGPGAIAVIPLLSRILVGLGGLAEVPVSLTEGVSLQVPTSSSQIALPTLALALLLAIGSIPVILKLLRVNFRLRRSESWGCGLTELTPRMEYTATAFAEPLRRVFAELYRPSKELTIDTHPESKYFVQSIAYRSEITPWFDRMLYTPLLHLIGYIANKIRRLQSGLVHLYLLYLALALMGLIFASRWIER
ncbi:MAG: hydrogenase 4 subunit B [Cyanosarcina radialis HA8281-LM2]|jgi:hydrogenase-4 component B|nr:hydrogenase 4 subunit B [Cyanosarcina radialis HA8281-LM2]